MKKLRGNLAVLKNSIKEALQYRFHFVVTVITAPLSLIVYWFLWKSIYAFSGQTIIRGFSFEMLISYFALNLIIGMLTYSFVDAWMSDEIRYGEVTSVFLKPIGYFSWFFFGEQGFKVLSVIIEVIPTFLISVFFFNLRIYSLAFFFLFLISLALALLINFLIAYNLGISAFWFKKITGLRRVRRSVVAFLSGSLIPLTFFPASFQYISYFLPFQYTKYITISIYLGQFSIINSIYLILIQLFWVFLLYYVSKIFLNKAVEKFTGEGI